MGDRLRLRSEYRRESDIVLKSDLPFGSEFSPSQIDLPELLELAITHAGDVKALQAQK